VSFIVDSTGLKVCGQGEWHTRKHGEKRRKRWKKLHIGVDNTGCILASKVTEGHEQDPSQVPDLLDQVDREIDRFVGDGIYDQEPVYEASTHREPQWLYHRGKMLSLLTTQLVFSLSETGIL